MQQILILQKCEPLRLHSQGGQIIADLEHASGDGSQSDGNLRLVLRERSHLCVCQD